MEQQTQTGWQHFEHLADMGVRGIGRTVDEAFANAALAFTAVITDLNKIEPANEIQIAISDDDLEVLLVDWLNALLFETITRNMLFSRFEVTVTGANLTARCWGEPIDRVKHAPAVEIKGATYTALSVKNENGLWIAQCIVDV